ncbi:MAG TPA: alpha/beta hydrolase [Anaerolineales bacterium]|nr:alpha/beta hydrolase [Anaerolineales bacterium]
MAKFRKIVRTLWITFGILFFLWMANSFRARGFDKSILESGAQITIEETSRLISFRPNLNQTSTGFIFFPGGLVQPEAYAPMSRAIAEHGFAVFIVKLPFGSAPLESQEADVMTQALSIIDTETSIQYWAVGGHSRGAAIASRFAYSYSDQFDGLVLIGTSHPKEKAFDLSNTNLSVTKVYASNDGLASVKEVEANAIYLPDDTNWVFIQGGNHSQFGYYGAQLADNAATISREEQQKITIEAVITALNNIQER